MEKILKVDGMSCNHCSNSVKGALADMGLSNVSVNLTDKTVTFDCNDNVDIQDVVDTIEDLGFVVE